MGWDPNAWDSDTGDDWRSRDPNAPSPDKQPPALDRTNFTGEPGARGGTQSISRSNYYWGGSEGGADRDVEGLRYQNDIAQQRGAVQIDTRRADAELARALAERGNQQVVLSGYRQQLTGRGPSAAQWGGQAALEAALTQQAAQTGQAPNAYLAAGQAGGQAMGASNAQYAGARGAEVAAAAHGFSGVASSQRVGDLMSAGMSQEQALHQAQLEAAQRARNDAMAQFYTAQENDIRRQQLAAMGAYEAQRDANAAVAGGDWQRRQSRANDRANAAYVNTADVLGKVMTMGAVSMKKDTDDDGR